MRSKILHIVICFLFAFGGIRLSAQSANYEEQTTRILFVLDASSSMIRDWGPETKWKTAVRVLNQIAGELNDVPNLEMGLRVYGHLSPALHNDCEDSKLEVTIGPNKANAMKYKLSMIKPNGITPIAYSLERCANDFPDEPGRNVIILITDGEESCDGDPCSISLSLKKKNIVLSPFVIGLDIPDFAADGFSCVGAVANADDAVEFEETLNVVVNRVLSNTTVQVNLNDAFGKPSETDVNMTFYDAHSDIPVYNFYHTINFRGAPDTISIDPAIDYDLVIHTIPPIRVEDIELIPNSHNVINVDAGRGSIKVEIDKESTLPGALDKMKCLVRKSDGFEYLNVQEVNAEQKYLNGNYELVLLTLPRILVTGVKVNQSKTTTIKIPQPGTLTLAKSIDAYGGIFMYEENELIKIHSLNDQTRRETIALQPGKYRVIYRPKFSKDMHTTIDKEFEIKSGENLSLNL
jgi:Ca-activated chloride channel family protein